MLSSSKRFQTLEKSWVRPLSWQVAAAWEKQRDDAISWGVYDQSLYDGSALYASDVDKQPTVQIWDTYKYGDVSERVKSMTIERSTEFPYSVQSAIADFEFANHDKYLTPYSNSPIARFLKPKIPMRAWLGFGNENVPQFVGLTSALPSTDPLTAIAEVGCLDFLSWALNQPIPNIRPIVEKDTAYILTEIFRGLGFAENQMDFSGATNKVPIFFPEKTENLADIVKKLVQAENGKLWQDELGVIRFSGKQGSIVEEIVATYTDDEIVSVEPSQAEGIINHIKIVTPIRVIAPYQMVHEKTSSGSSTDSLWVVTMNTPITREASLSDPCTDVVVPTLGMNSSVSWFTAKTSNGTYVTQGVRCELELTPSKAIMTFVSSLPYAVEIDQVFLWGQPAKQVDELDYEVFHDTWRDDDDHVLEITDNQFFGNYDNARAYAISVFTSYANYNPTVSVELKGTPRLQIGDAIELKSRAIDGTYQIFSISQKLADSKLTTSVQAKRATVYDIGRYDVSIYDGGDLYGF